MLCETCGFVDCGVEQDPTAVDVKTADLLDVGHCLLQQQQSGSYCDVVLQSGDVDVRAHRCVIVIRSPYFVSLFSSPLPETCTDHCFLPEVSESALFEVLKYLYTGDVCLTMNLVEDIITLADFLCVQSLSDACTEFLKTQLCCLTSPIILNIAEKFLLPGLKLHVFEFLSPRIGKILQSYLAKSFSKVAVWSILNSTFTNYVREKFLVDFILSWANARDEDSNECDDLADALEASYLSQQDLQAILSSKTCLVDGKLKSSLKRAWESILTPQGDVLREVVFCRGKGDTRDARVRIYLYDLNTNIWHVLPEPAGFEICFDDVESFYSWDNKIFFLTSRSDDLCGYLHCRRTLKKLFRLNLRDGSWAELSAPQHCGDRTRLFAHGGILCVMDQRGVTEGMREDGRWEAKCVHGFSQQCTVYFLPIAVQSNLYALQVLGGAGTCHDSEDWFTLYRYDREHSVFRIMTQVGSGDTGLNPNEKIHGYLAYPDKIVLKNGLGENRLQYAFTTREWTTLPTGDGVQSPIKDIWGYTQFRERTYLVGQDSLSQQKWMFYDWVKKRFKETPPPPGRLSGLVVQASISDLAFRVATEVRHNTSDNGEPGEPGLSPARLC